MTAHGISPDSAGLSAAGRRKLATDLRRLQQISPWPGLLHLAVRLPLQLALITLSFDAWMAREWWAFAGFGLLSAVAYASLMSLTHDALHHRLTGIGWFDDVVARLVSWPMSWAIGCYKYVHLIHHRMAGSDLADPELVSPRQRSWQGSRVRQFMLRHQVWVAMFGFGAVGLLLHLLKAVRSRLGESRFRRALTSDAIGIAITIGLLALMAWLSGASRGLAGFGLLWIMHERVIGIAHQFRNHMEHYGVWEPHANGIDTQYTSARSIRTNLVGRLMFNNLSRHAEHHVWPSVPFYNLEEAHAVLANAYRAEGLEVPETPGYFAALREVMAAMRGEFAVDSQRPARLRSIATN